MLVSLNWLQTYFEKELPEAERISDLFNFHSFEIESVEGRGNDVIFDVKVLADRACYALSHRGVAGELATAGNFQIKIEKIQEIPAVLSLNLKIEVKKPDLCPRYAGRLVENVKIISSPEWLRQRLEAIGERSVNHIVDAANFTMFDIGQPLHVFDADKVEGTIQVRLAKDSEKMTTLDGKEVSLDSSMLVIADNKGPLAIAGIKGGKRAEVTESTTRLILEAANFNRESIRLTSKKTDFRTGAARRFEANLSPVLAEEAMKKFSSLIKELSPDAKFGAIVDVYKKKQKARKIGISPKFVSEILGVSVSEEEIFKILGTLGIYGKKVKGKLQFLIPPLRTDLNLPEDLVEEVGRLYGYDKIAPAPLPQISGKPFPHREFYYIEKIKKILTESGYSEIYLYTLAPKGFLKIEHPLAEDKKYLRTNLLEGIKKSLEENLKNTPFLGASEVRIFEVGKIFNEKGERISVGLGRATTEKKSGRANGGVILEEILRLLSSSFGHPINAKIVSDPAGALCEIDLTDIIPKLRPPDSYVDLELVKSPGITFKMFSEYPFILRDIAVFVPKGISAESILETIKREGGEFLRREDIFDVFEKKFPDNSVKVSHAFHLVFQSFDKTLTDGEINPVMEKITAALNSNTGWQVR